MSTSPATNTAQGSSRLLALPSEIRNSIYEYVLADVEGNICIELEGGDNKCYKVIGKKSKSVPSKDKASRLGLLLTCKTINTEASAMAYSKMFMSLDHVFDLGTIDLFEQGVHRLSDILHNFTRVFPRHLISQIAVMEFTTTRVLLDLVEFNTPSIDRQRNAGIECTAKCASLSWFHGLLHTLFHKVKRIVVESRREPLLYGRLTEGASWLSVTMEPHELGRLLNVFSNLEEIVVRRKCGEQVSKVIDGKVYAAESGMEMLGTKDWLHNRR